MAALVAGVAMVGAVLAPEDRHPILHGRCSMVAMLSFPAGTALLAVATAGDSRLRRRVPLGWFALSLVILVWAAVAFTLRPATETELAIPVTLQKVAGVVLVATLVSQGYEAERIAAADPSSTTSPEVRNHADRARE
jgi:ABC-type transport system involved in cytochrome c biogenesis permease subunit